MAPPSPVCTDPVPPHALLLPTLASRASKVSANKGSFQGANLPFSSTCATSPPGHASLSPADSWAASLHTGCEIELGASARNGSHLKHNPEAVTCLHVCARGCTPRNTHTCTYGLETPLRRTAAVFAEDEIRGLKYRLGFQVRTTVFIPDVWKLVFIKGSLSSVDNQPGVLM